MGKRLQREFQANSKTLKPIPEKFKRERSPPPILPKTKNQDTYHRALNDGVEQIIALGPAGTGKTFLAATYAADSLRQQFKKKVILVRPNVPSGRPLGFYPGTPDEKIEPWLKPLLNTMSDRMGSAAFEIARKNKSIEIVAFETMRGDTWNNAVVILDEAQNTTTHEMKMFLTRIGENTQVIVNGDISQSDLKGLKSGLNTMIDLKDSYDLPVTLIEFGIEDVVRSGICEMWVKAFYQFGL